MKRFRCKWDAYILESFQQLVIIELFENVFKVIDNEIYYKQLKHELI